MQAHAPCRRLPAWFKVRLSTNERYSAVRGRIREGKLHTVCESAACPNRNECWNAGTATFLILGTLCTRSCTFCNIPSGEPRAVDQDEPRRVAGAVALMGLAYAVVTSVTRDDLPDGGAKVFADVLLAIRRSSPHCRVEVLIPDFQGSCTSLEAVLAAGPHVVNHNIETVPSLYPRVRPGADYGRSLRLLERAKQRGFVTKSGIMLGLGEGTDEIRTVLQDLRSAGCDILTIGQYLRPSLNHLPVERYYRPEEFESIRSEALGLGFRGVAAGPLVRSSYHASRYGAGSAQNEQPSL
jgi:lipoic acid synthetase